MSTLMGNSSASAKSVRFFLQSFKNLADIENMDIAKLNMDLNMVDNTRDADKIVSGPQQAALNLKENSIPYGLINQFFRGDKMWAVPPGTAQVQSDWTQADGSAVDYIKNKPTIPAAQVNSDWNAVTGVPQILNKPTIPSAQIQSDWTQTNPAAVDYIKNKPSIVINNSVTRSLVTSTGAVGYQASATRNVEGRYSVTLSTTASIGGAAAVTVALEVAPTNSSIASDWVEVGRISNSQTITLAIALQSVQISTQQVTGVIPAGYYAKLRVLGTSGTQSSSYVSGQEVLL